MIEKLRKTGVVGSIVLSTGVRVQGGLSTDTHTHIHTHPALFWGLELKVLCDITGRLWSVLCLISLAAS